MGTPKLPNAAIDKTAAIHPQISHDEMDDDDDKSSDIVAILAMKRKSGEEVEGDAGAAV
jgi:hypothetical protein